MYKPIIGDTLKNINNDKVYQITNVGIKCSAKENQYNDGACKLCDGKVELSEYNSKHTIITCVFKYVGKLVEYYKHIPTYKNNNINILHM